MVLVVGLDAVDEGEIVGLLGRSGAGKTTSFRMAIGMISPEQGVVRFGGKVVTGRIVSNQDGNLTVITDPFDANKVVRMARGEIDEVRPSPTSLMPVGLLDKLNQDEVLDLIAYLLSRGNPSDLLFR